MQVLVKLLLLEGFIEHQAAVSLGNVMGITTDRRDQHRQTRHQGLQQHRPGVLVVGRVNQQVGTEQEARNIAAPLEELHVITQAQRRTLQLEHLGVVLTDHHQPGTFAQVRRQCRQGFQAAIDAFGLETRTDLHQQQLIVRQLELAAKRRTNLCGVGRRPAILGDARRQQVETLQRRAVVFDEQWLLHFGDHQDFSLGLWRKYRPLVLGKMPVAAPTPVQRVTQGLRLVLEAAVSRIVNVQAGHLVETDQAIDRAFGQVGRHPGTELFIASVVEQRLDRRHQHFKARRYIALPDQRVDTDLVPATLALQRNAHEVALQATEREILVEHKSQLHQRTSSASSSALSRPATCSGFKRVKHNGHSRLRSNRR